MLKLPFVSRMRVDVYKRQEKGRAIRPDLKCGICGEHGGEPSSVKFCHKVGLNLSLIHI